MTKWLPQDVSASLHKPRPPDVSRLHINRVLCHQWSNRVVGYGVTSNTTTSAAVSVQTVRIEEEDTMEWLDRELFRLHLFRSSTYRCTENDILCMSPSCFPAGVFLISMRGLSECQAHCTASGRNPQVDGASFTHSNFVTDCERGLGHTASSVHMKHKTHLGNNREPQTKAKSPSPPHTHSVNWLGVRLV